MNAIKQQSVATPEDAKSLLQYLAVTNLRSARTIEALRDLCPGDPTTENALQLLLENGYVYEEDESFELTFTGLQAARLLQLQAQSISLSTVKRVTPQPRGTPPPLPTIETYPLRTQVGTQGTGSGARQTLRYLLAFETPGTILPIPVLDRDVLGRRSDANISLPQDEFLSGLHCCFKIEPATGVLSVEDLGSRNGSFVDDVQLEKGRWVELTHGSRLTVGSTVLRVVEIPA